MISAGSMTFSGRGSCRSCRTAARVAMQPLGKARDWDVCLEWLQRTKAPQVLLRRVQGRRDAARRYLRVPQLESLAPEPAAWKARAESLQEYRLRALAKARRKVAKRARGIEWHDPAQRHRLRIAVKRLRYAIGFLGSDEPKALEDLQDVLGELNDLAVARRLLAEHYEVEAVADGEAALAAARARRPDLIRNAPFGKALPWVGLAWLVFPVWVYAFGIIKPIWDSLTATGVSKLTLTWLCAPRL